MKKHDDDDSLEDIFRELKSSVQAREEREKNQENNDDRMFLLSLLNPMKKIPENMKLEVRSQIIQIIANASYPTSNNPDISSYNHAFEANSFNQEHETSMIGLRGNTNLLRPVHSDHNKSIYGNASKRGSPDISSFNI